MRGKNQKPYQVPNPSIFPKDKNGLLAEIKRKRQHSEYLAQKIHKLKIEHKKQVDTVHRRSQRLLKYEQKHKDLWKHRNQPEYFLHATGLMNQFMQQYIFSHQHQFGMDVPHDQINPDIMTYEQLIELGDSMGKVSKGITKQQFEDLEKIKNTLKNQSCTICVTELEIGEVLVKLPCKHLYHEQCIGEWLKDENVCPVCKISVLIGP